MNRSDVPAKQQFPKLAEPVACWKDSGLAFYKAKSPMSAKMNLSIFVPIFVPGLQPAKLQIKLKR
jgi:hypothetical protein